mmetsp:Transcript_20950/g.29570  ORF Transcript_20950/g.29570 Transcript_20950/m.29570 type:complete len:488 (+) Transcript_20950:192-1655(+)
MKFIATLSALFAFSTSTTAFAPAAFAPRASSSASISSSQLFISSWGTKGSPYANRADETQKVEDPEAKIQSYLKTPESVTPRDNLVGTKALVSGLVKTKERTDQTIFDLLNDEDAAFEFSSIVAFVNDEKFAKKRLLSRSARYTGLLDKLDFVEAETPDALPTVAQLEGVTSWVAYLEDGNLEESAEQVATLAKDAGVKNLAVLLVGANGVNLAATQSMLEGMKGDVDYSVIAVGKLEEHAEGKVPYQFRALSSDEGVLAEDAIFSRDESLRMVTECLQLEAGIHKTLSCSEVYNVNQTEARLIKGLREGGYTRPQEIDHMLRDGPENYQKAIDEYKEKNPNGAEGTSDLWWEQPEYALKHTSYEEQEEMRQAEIKDKRNTEVEKIAKEWAKREFFRKSMAGSIEEGMTEEEFIKSVWDRAMFEGDLKYRQMQGETTNEESELADFKQKQEIKKQTMLKRAKQELADLLDEEDLGGIDGPSEDEKDE